jgi:Galactose oxidase, central domain/Kelch motif
MDVNEIGHEWLIAADSEAPVGPRTESSNQGTGAIQLSARSALDTSVAHASDVPPAPAGMHAPNGNPTFISHQDLLRQQAHDPVSATAGNNYLNPSSLASTASANVSIQAYDNRIAATSTTTTTAATTGSNNNDNDITDSNSNNAPRLPLPILRTVPRVEDLNITNNSGPRFIHRGPPEAESDPGVLSPHGSSNTSASGWSLVTENNGGTPPPTRSLHAAAVLNNVMYAFGGYDGATRVNTFHAYSFAEKRWSPVHAIGGPPGPRDRHVAFAFGFKFFIHGGFNGTSRVSDFWGFDLSSMTWREVIVLGGRPPSPRHSHSAVVHRHSLYIYGGYDGSYSKCLHALPAAGGHPRAAPGWLPKLLRSSSF